MGEKGIAENGIAFLAGCCFAFGVTILYQANHPKRIDRDRDVDLTGVTAYTIAPGGTFLYEAAPPKTPHEMSSDSPKPVPSTTVEEIDPIDEALKACREENDTLWHQQERVIESMRKCGCGWDGKIDDVSI